MLGASHLLSNICIVGVNVSVRSGIKRLPELWVLILLSLPDLSISLGGDNEDLRAIGFTIRIKSALTEDSRGLG